MRFHKLHKRVSVPTNTLHVSHSSRCSCIVLASFHLCSIWIPRCHHTMNWRAKILSCKDWKNLQTYILFLLKPLRLWLHNSCIYLLKHDPRRWLLGCLNFYLHFAVLAGFQWPDNSMLFCFISWVLCYITLFRLGLINAKFGIGICILRLTIYEWCMGDFVDNIWHLSAHNLI